MVGFGDQYLPHSQRGYSVHSMPLLCILLQRGVLNLKSLDNWLGFHLDIRDSNAWQHAILVQNYGQTYHTGSKNKVCFDAAGTYGRASLGHDETD